MKTTPRPNRRVLAGAVALLVVAAAVVIGVQHSVSPSVPQPVTLVAAPVAGDRGAPAIQTAVECQPTGPVLVVTVSPHTSPAVGTVQVGEQLAPTDLPHPLGAISIAGPTKSPAESRFPLTRLDGTATVGADAWVLPTPLYVDYFCAGAPR